MDLDWSVVTPDQTTRARQQPPENTNAIYSTSKSPSQDTVENGIGITESGVPSLKASTSLEVPFSGNATNVNLSSHGIDITRTGDSGIIENPSPRPPGDLEDPADSSPVPLEPPQAPGDSAISGMRKYDPRTSPPPLIRAVYRGDIEEVKSLLAARNDIEACHPGNRRTAAMVAAILGDSEILEIFLGSGASLTTRDRVKRTPLHYAASEGMIDCVNLLLSRKAPLDCKDFYGDLPLHCAVRCSSEEAVKAMLTEYPNPLQYLARFSKNILHLAAATRPSGIM